MAQPTPADPRTTYAAFRTSLALDRTTLAWIRTALTFATFGLGMIGFFRTLSQSLHTPRAEHLHDVAVSVGVALVGVGIVSLLLVAVSHFRAVRLLARGETPALAGAQLSIATAVLVALMCTYALWVFTS